MATQNCRHLFGKWKKLLTYLFIYLVFYTVFKDIKPELKPGSAQGETHGHTQEILTKNFFGYLFGVFDKTYAMLTAVC